MLLDDVGGGGPIGNSFGALLGDLRVPKNFEGGGLGFGSGFMLYNQKPDCAHSTQIYL